MRIAGQLQEIDQEGAARSLRALVPKPKPTPKMPAAIVPKTEAKLATLRALASELGYFFTPSTQLKTELATKIASSLRTREGAS